jgi:hypothetical protein
MSETHEEGLETLHNQYHRYKLGFRGYSKAPLEYIEWLEHTTVRLARKLGEADEKIEWLEEERGRAIRSAQANLDAWLEMKDERNKMLGFVASLRHHFQMGNMAEVLRLVLHYCCWN